MSEFGGWACIAASRWRRRFLIGFPSAPPLHFLLVNTAYSRPVWPGSSDAWAILKVIRTYRAWCMNLSGYQNITHAPVCLSVCLPIYRSLCLSLYLSVCLFIYPSIYINFINLSSAEKKISLYLSLCLSIYVSIYLYMSVYLSSHVYIFILVSSYLSV
jgi:hypothetical protein